MLNSNTTHCAPAGWLTAAQSQADSPEGGGAGSSSRLGTTPVLDLDSVYTGTWDPNNIAIHVSQNAVNFFTSSAFWALASFFYQAPSKKRSASSDFYQTSYNTVGYL